MLRSSIEGPTAQLRIFFQPFFRAQIYLYVVGLLKEIFWADPFVSPYVLGKTLWNPALCFLTQNCQEFLYIGLATRKLCVDFFVKRSWSGISHTQWFCSPSKFTIAGGTAKWWASLPVVKPQHRFPKRACCCLLSCLHWFVNPYSLENVILFLFLTLPPS